MKKPKSMNLSKTRKALKSSVSAVHVYGLLILFFSSSLLAAGPWEKARLELHEYTIMKMKEDNKLQDLNRRVNTLYQKLDKLVNASSEIIKLRKALAQATGKQRVELQEKLNEAEANFLKQGTIEAEEARELLETLDMLNKKIYEELNKDEKFRSLRKFLQEVSP